MATMHALPVASSYGFRPAGPARLVVRQAPAARAANLIPGPQMVRAADAAMRFGLALLPFSALVGMFVWM